MEDLDFWWYIIAAVIYFLTRGKKKKAQQPRTSRPEESKPDISRPGTENNPKQPPKSFEDLLREITGGSREDTETLEQGPMVVSDTKPSQQASWMNEEKEREEQRKSEGERRAFADEESRKVYEASIKQAEGADIAFEREEHFRQPSLLKRLKDENQEEEYTFADEIRDGLSSSEARKAIIYSEILNRKY